MSIDPRMLVHVTEAPETARRRLVPRVFAPRPGTDTKVLRFRLEKALERGDQDAALEVWKSMSDEDRDEIRKGGAALPGDPSRAVPAGPTKTNWASAFKLPRWGGRPAQSAPQPAPPPARAAVVAVGTGGVRRVFRPRVGAIVNFTTKDGELVHGKIRDWAEQGALVVTPTGEFGVDWSQITEGVHPAAREEHEGLVRKARAAEEADFVKVMLMDPETRARHYADRDL